jgi:hypothetical protein
MNTTRRYWLTIQRDDGPERLTMPLVADAHPSADRRGYTVRTGHTVQWTQHATSFPDAVVLALAELPGQQLEAILDAAAEYLDQKCDHGWSIREKRAGDTCETCERETTEERWAEQYAAADEAFAPLPVARARGGARHGRRRVRRGCVVWQRQRGSRQPR